MISNSLSFIQCADLHLDSCMETHLSPLQAQARRHELLHTFSKLADYASDHSITAVLICGDLFESEFVSSQSLEFVLHCIFEHDDVDFLYLPGNHDYRIDRHLEEFSPLPENLYCLSAPIDPSNPAVFQKRYGKVTISALYGLPDGLPELDPAQINLVMLHGSLTDAASSSSDGHGNFLYSRQELCGRHIDYIAAGHIHSHSLFSLDSYSQFCYSGCLEGRGFDECGEKGFVLLTVTDTDSRRQITPEFIPFAGRLLYDISVPVCPSDSLEEIQENMQQQLCEIESRHLVRVHLTGERNPETPLITDLLSAPYRELFFLFVLLDETVPAVTADDYRYDISLKGEFVRQVLQSSEALEDKNQILAYGLRLLAGKGELL